MIKSVIAKGKAVASPCNVVFDATYDVIVAGVGTGGSVAALAAAKEGLSVLGIESFTCLGGTHTVGGIAGHYFGIPGGLYEEYDNQIFEYSDRIGSRLEGRKLLTEKLALDMGIQLLYESTVSGIYIEDARVRGVEVVTPNGVKNFACFALMDGTGDGVVSHMAGCESMWGREIDGATQPYSMVSIQKGDKIGWWHTNRDFGRVDQRDDKALTDAYIFSRSYELPEVMHGQLVRFMPFIGVREGRRMITEEVITLSDLFEERYSKTPAFYSYADLDKHGWDYAFDDELMCDWGIGANLAAFNVTIPISFKALIPKGIDGLIIASRCLGIDEAVSSCTRMIPDVKKIGESAAHIAAVAKENGCKFKDVPYKELKAKLESTGCLGENYDLRTTIDGLRGDNGERLPKQFVDWITQPEKLNDGLKTNKPGIAIWSAKRMGIDKVGDILKKNLASDDKNLVRHSAFALALLGDSTGVPVLNQMIEEKDTFLCEDCRKNNQRRSFMAIYYVGKLRNASSVDLLIDIITNKNEHKHSAYSDDSNTIRYSIEGFNNAIFQQFSGAVAALIKIGDAHVHLRKKISNAFDIGLGNNEYITRITTRHNLTAEYSMVANIKKICDDAVCRWKK